MRLGLDAGGTYTDAVLWDGSRIIHCTKSLTTRPNPIGGLRNSLNRLFGDLALEDPNKLIDFVGLSSTLATNAVVEGFGAPAALILIGLRPHQMPQHPKINSNHEVPIIMVDGGHDAHGNELCELDLQSLQDTIKAIEPNVAAFSVCGQFAVRNNAHELRVKQFLETITNKPVTCSHQLSHALNATIRAATCVFNSRLIPLIAQLIDAVEQTLAQHNIKAPVYLVRADGGVMPAQIATSRPIETLLSGPAASAIGAATLAKQSDALVIDIGGTTSDFASIQNSQPILADGPVQVGDQKLLVRALNISTCGLGGDSEITFYPKVKFGPRRVIPLSILAGEHASVCEDLRKQLDENFDGDYCTRFLIANDEDPSLRKFSQHEKQIWEQLREGRVRLLYDIISPSHSTQPLQRLIDNGLIRIADFTPCDVQHILGKQDTGDKNACIYAGEILTRLHRYKSVKQMCAELDRCFVRYLVRVTFQHANILANGPYPLSDELLDTLEDDKPSLHRLSPTFTQPIIVVGGPAKLYAKRLGKALQTKVSTPKFGHVANAIGAVSGLLKMQSQATILSPDAGLYRVMAQNCSAKDFANEARATEFAIDAISDASAKLIEGYDRTDLHINIHQMRRVAHNHDGSEIFIENTITATASRKI